MHPGQHPAYFQRHLVRQWLHERGLKQNWLAAQVGCTPNMLTKWMTGYHEPSLHHVIRLSAVTGLSLYQLLGLRPRRRRRAA